MTGAPLVEVDDLHVGYRRDSAVHPAVRGVSLAVGPGESVAVVGGSGSGKSTLAHAVLGLLPAAGIVTGGRIAVEGEDVTGAPDRVLRRIRGSVIGLVPQDPTVGLNPTARVGAQVAEAVRRRGVPGRSLAPEVLGLLAAAGLDQPGLRARQYPHQLSGGLRQRVLIAVALAGRPRMVIADEPTSALDATVQRRILDHLQTLVADRGIALLLITHDLGLAADRAERIVVLDDGRVAEEGPTRGVLTRPASAATRRLVDAAPALTGSLVDLVPVASARESSGPVLLALEGLGKTFPLPRTPGGPTSLRAVDDVSLTVERGRTLALVGESGSGKTTTLRMALGLERPSSGRVLFDGQDLGALPRAELRRLRRRFQLVQQNPYAALDPRFRVVDAITEPLVALRVGTRATRVRRAAELMEQVGLSAEHLRRRPAELSGGQRQRVAIARALAVEPDLVFLDEPVSALDVVVQRQILTLLTDLQQRLGLTYVFVSHDLAVVAQVAHTVAVLAAGRVVEHGPTAQVLTRPATAYTTELLGAVTGRTFRA